MDYYLAAMLLANQVYRAGSKDKAVASSADDARRRPLYSQQILSLKRTAGPH